jgi:phosphatidate cytidylyltransferase
MNIPTALKQRILTSLILIPVVLILLFLTPNFLYASIVAAISLYAAWEWTRLMNISSFNERVIYLVILGLLIIFSYLFHLWKKELIYQSAIFLLASLWWLIALFFIFRYNRGDSVKIFNRYFYGFIGILLIYSFWLGLVVIRTMSPRGSFWVLVLLVLIWFADSSAYFCGIRYGTRKLVPKVSPGKTLEGLYGQLAFSLIAIIIIADLIAPNTTQFLILLLFGMLTVIASIIGDLFISVLKRQRGLKDTGQILPGHGGLLDRIDSLLGAVPVFTLGLILFRISLNSL